MKKILFLGIGRRVELVQAFRNAALVLGKDIIIYGEDISSTAPALAFCDIRFPLCEIKAEGYIDTLLNNAVKEHIDLIIPTIDTNLLILSENRKRFEEKGVKVLISSSEMMRICRDKNKTAQYFLDCGLRAPRTINSIDRLVEFVEPYPYFIKPRDGSSSINAYKVQSRKELEVYSKEIEDYIIQPFIEGEEYTVDIFCDFSGNPIYITPRKRLAVRAGEVLKTQICLDEQIINECKKIVERSNPCGPITVQMIRDAEGQDWYIEINPRFGGGAPLSMKAGAKSAEALLALLCEESVNVHNIENGVVFSRFDQSVRVMNEQSELSKNTIKGVIFDLDDTLYSEKEYVRSGYKKVAEYLGDAKLTDELWTEFEAGKKAIDEVLRKLDKIGELENCLRIYREHKPIISLYDGVKELIDSLKERNIHVGIITDGRPNGQRNKLEALGLWDLIGEQDIIITDELGGSQFRKPCDLAFRIMARRWRMDFENIVYVGDNARKDFQAPQQLGMKYIWFRNQQGMYFTNDNEYIKISSIAELVINCILGGKSL